MKKEVLTQRFNYGIITLYKDYSNISEKPADRQSLHEIGQVCGSTITDIDDTFEINLVEEDESLRRLRVSFEDNLFGCSPEKISNNLLLHGKKFGKKRNTKYFYNENENGEETIKFHSKQRLSHFTTKDRQIKRHYGNPFSSIYVHLIERSIKIDGDKICVRVYSQSKTRELNCKYFKRRKSTIGFVFNIKTGNFITYDTSGDSKSFRQNNFNHLLNVVKNILDKSTINHLSISGDTSVSRTDVLLKKELDNNEFNSTLFHLIGKHLNNRENYFFTKDLKSTQQADQLLDWTMKLFLDINKIKVPNLYKVLLMEWYPTKPFLKKNDNKLIVSILDRLGLKTKSMIKLMHKDNFDIKKVLLLVKYFGYKDISKYLSNIHPDFLGTLWKHDSMSLSGIETSYHFFQKPKEYYLTSREKTNILKLINQLFIDNGNAESLNKVTGNAFRQFDDHFNMIAKIRKYIPETEMRATTQMEFHHEHLELSKIERTIRKGYSIQYTFEKRLIDTIEKVILNHVSDDTYFTTTAFYPVILKTDAEYTEEGGHMHHCVATYADSENSLIISLRENSSIGDERVTCEYSTKTKELIQAKSFCNAKPPERFENVIEELTKRIKKFRGSIKSTGKEKIPLLINGIEVAPPPKDEFTDLMDRLALL
jgi:hypothetical protein